ncbi:MAG: hypothetical protein H6883_07285 [Rhodobiaceae bacterium]|nr:hypothetical protein [Rhodobiaceae bacterium]MCC0055923.1 hypothetical protein [Rhodobiaceae bacterium]
MMHAFRGALRLACVLAVALPTFAYGEPSDLVPPQGTETRGGARSAVVGSQGRTVAIARSYIGKNPTGHAYLWCARFLNVVEKKAGRPGTGSAHSSSFLKYGQRVSRSAARPGDIVYRPRRGGGHVELFVRWADQGRTRYVAISGNSCGKRGKRYVCEVTRTVSGAHRFVRPR